VVGPSPSGRCRLTTPSRAARCRPELGWTQPAPPSNLASQRNQSPKRIARLSAYRSADAAAHRSRSPSVRHCAQRRGDHPPSIGVGPLSPFCPSCRSGWSTPSAELPGVGACVPSDGADGADGVGALSRVRFPPASANRSAQPAVLTAPTAAAPSPPTGTSSVRVQPCTWVQRGGRNATEPERMTVESMRAKGPRLVGSSDQGLAGEVAA
jgi:hypothetical protein